jgi:hypothetical protein
MLRRFAVSFGCWRTAFFCVIGIIFFYATADMAGEPPPAKPAAESLTQSQQDAFQWFDGLGFPSLKDRQLVLVATGQWFRSADNSLKNTYRLAFLLKSEGDQFTVLDLDLKMLTFMNSVPGTPEHLRRGYGKLDFKEQVEEYLKTLRAPQSRNNDNPSLISRHIRNYGFSRDATPMFVLARACAADGLAAQAKELSELAEKSFSEGFTDEDSKSLRKAVAKQIAQEEMEKLLSDFGNPEVSRKELLERFERIIKHFPDSAHIKRAGETAEMLRQMVREDEERAKLAKPPENMSVQERVADLIYQLRDQNWRLWSQFGRSDPFLDPSRGNSPAQELVKLDFDAVPALIEALGDRRFSRAVGVIENRDLIFNLRDSTRPISICVLRVGDCARAVLENIAARDFYRLDSTHSEMSTDNAAEEVKRNVRAWWEQIQKKGEKQMLIEGVERGDYNVISQANRLLSKYPDDALPAIARGAMKTQEVSTRHGLIQLVGRIKGDAPVPFLMEQMKQGATLGLRVAAARELLRHLRPESVTAMLDEWKKLSTSRKDGNAYDDGFDVERLIEFLAGSGSTEAIGVLAEGMRKRPVDVKVAIIEDINSQSNWNLFTSVEGGPLAAAGGNSNNESLRMAVEDLLVAALDDTERHMGMSGSWGDKSFSDPRICDLAGHVLWKQWPKKYDFDLAASLAVRDRQRVELKNVWRKDHGLPLLELPQPPRIKYLGKEDLRPLWDSILRANGEKERTAAVSAVEAKGLSALPTARELLGEVAADAQSRAALESLVRRLSVVVREVIVEDQSLSDDHPLAKALKTAKDKPLTADQFVGLILAFTKQPPQQLPGIALSAERTGDDTGVVIRLKPIKQKTIPTLQVGNDKGWETSEYVTVGRKNLLGSSGGDDFEHGQREGTYREFASALAKALTRPPDEPMEAIITVVQQK